MDLTPTQFGSADADLPTVEAVLAPAPGAAEAAASSKLEPLICKFLRSFHVLLRAVRLYQRNHPRVTESLESAERDLRTILAQVPALSIKIARDAVTATTRDSTHDTRPLPDLRGELRVLSLELSGAGVASLIFLRRVNLGELALFAHALDAASRTAVHPSAGRGSASPNWLGWLAEHQITGIQINATLQRREETILALLLAALPATPPNDTAALDASISSTADQVRTALRFLSALTARLEQAQQYSQQDAARAVRAELAAADSHTLALLAGLCLQDPPLDGDIPGPYLARVADALAVQFARAEYLAERIGAAEVRPLLAGLEERDGNDAAPEARAEARIERFWFSLPARAIGRVLSGPDAWCLPVPVFRLYLDPLLAAAEHKHAQASGSEARRALATFVLCLQHERSSVRRAVAAGLMEMADLLPRLWPHPQLAGLAASIVTALARESSPAAGVLLASATETLARLALDRRCYAEFEQILNDLDAVPATSREPVQPLARRLSEPQYWIPLVDAALANRPLDPALPRLLQRDPGRLLDRLGFLLASPEGAGLAPAMARLIRASSETVLRALETDLSGTRRQRIATAIKLMSAAVPERLLAALPRTLAKWEWNLQDLAVTELARQTDPGVRRQVALIFLDLLKDAHPHVVPGMIDLIALAREESAVARLIEMATSEIHAAQDTFVRIKAIEALGRLRATAATPRLREVSTKRSGLTHSYPAGLRSAAEDALDLLEGRLPAVAGAVSPLHDPADVNQKAGFSRPRRYRRVALTSPLPASIDGPQSAPARVRAIALGGALVETGSRLAIGDSMQIEIHSGLGRIRSTAVVRNSSPDGYGVEFVHMEEDDREKLRRRMVKLLH